MVYLVRINVYINPIFVKNSYYPRYILLIIFATVILTSCKKDEPLPDSLAGFEVSTSAPEIDLPVKFNNLSLNAARYEWDFGDGSSISQEISPSHTYAESDTYLVSLTSYNEDGKTSTEAKEVYIGQRYLTYFSILNINDLDSLGNPWDQDGSGPDVYCILGPTAAKTLDEVIDVFIDSLNVGQNKTPIKLSLENGYIPPYFQLRNEDYFVLLQDIDTIDNKPVPVLMAGADFNPLFEEEDSPHTVVKFDNGWGYITIPWIVTNEFQFYMEFVID